MTVRDLGMMDEKREADEAAVERFVDWLTSMSSDPYVLYRVHRSGSALSIDAGEAAKLVSRWAEQDTGGGSK